MACGATLKRTLDFDPVHSPSGRSSKRRRCIPVSSQFSNHYNPTEMQSSNFEDAAFKLTPDQIASKIREEMKRFQKRKQLYYSSTSLLQDMDSPSSPESPVATSPTCSSFGIYHVSKDKPLFTFRQVGLICERLLKERESHLRQEYEQVLNAKLAEQYDAFVKFTYDQIQRRFEAANVPSYLS